VCAPGLPFEYAVLNCTHAQDPTSILVSHALLKTVRLLVGGYRHYQDRSAHSEWRRQHKVRHMHTPHTRTSGLTNGPNGRRSKCMSGHRVS
jgi:hypothetical protein